jgi:predicted transposase YdaD
MLTAEAAYWADMKVEREIGRDEKGEEIARKARKKGLDNATIAELTGLDIETINSFPGPGDGAI